ncbi:MAG: hypothetical protein ACM3WS_07390, partial [Bacillota bacterium]
MTRSAIKTIKTITVGVEVFAYPVQKSAAAVQAFDCASAKMLRRTRGTTCEENNAVILAQFTRMTGRCCPLRLHHQGARGYRMEYEKYSQIET